MKKHLLLLLGLVLALQMPLLTACSDDDDDDVATSDVPQAVLTAFAAKYPEATNVKWEKELETYKAEYYNADHNEVDVWFSPDGTWLRTATDLLPTALPEAVQQYVATNYPDRSIDDCDLIEIPGASYYLLELEKGGAADLYLKLTADGELIP
ncbi:MAG: PepSY-like domain-containing protein [Bacteroidaceae bacterium]|nr:PepSY-like domain-containing protein [Bacteroidaceae bacterium]